MDKLRENQEHQVGFRFTTFKSNLLTLLARVCSQRSHRTGCSTIQVCFSWNHNFFRNLQAEMPTKFCLPLKRTFFKKINPSPWNTNAFSTMKSFFHKSSIKCAVIFKDIPINYPHFKLRLFWCFPKIQKCLRVLSISVCFQNANQNKQHISSESQHLVSKTEPPQRNL